MATYQQYQQQLAKALKDASARSPSVPGGGGGVLPALEALIDALPYYGDPDWEKAHRGALANLLVFNLPNNGIAPQPRDAQYLYQLDYSYTGPYSGYTDAFFHGIGLTTSAADVAVAVQGVNGSVTGGWWGNYGVAVLTDAIRQKISPPLNTSKLATDLSNYNAVFLPALSASYLAVFRNGYSPTATALNALSGAGQAAQACSELTSAIIQGQFTANINQAISMGGDSTNAAVWFLFNLWIALKALGATDVDGDIRRFQSAGLSVPSQVGPASWWNGGYTSWYSALSGSDLVGSASGMITASLPEQVVETNYTTGTAFPPRDTAASNGYSLSLCYWGSLNWYKP